MHEARGLGIVLADRAVSALTIGMARLPAVAVASASAPRSNSSALAFAIAGSALTRMIPERRLRPCQRRLEVEHVFAVAASSQTVRIAALDSIGASRGKGTCSSAYTT